MSAFNLFQQTANVQKQDTAKTDSVKADSVRRYQPSRRSTYQMQDRYGDPFSNTSGQSPFLLGDPASLSLDVEIDSNLNYTIYEKIGDINFRPTSSMTFEEFSQYQDEEMLTNYWRERSLGLDGESAVSGRSLIPPLYVSPAFDRLFGGSTVQIVPNGFVTLDFGARFTKNANPNIPVQSQRYSSFEFEPQINMNAVGKVGEKLAVTANFANNNSFDYQNDLKVEYTGYEEEIVKKIEIGNVSMPVNNSLITGAQNLFGVKTQLQFGHLYVTSVASTQRGTAETITVSGGQGQRQEFEVRASDYDENRHFFLGHFFRDNYENWLNNLPNFTSGLNITRVEVFVINRTQTTNAQRRIAAFMDLGEANPANIYRDDFINPNVPITNPTNNEANVLWSEVQQLDKNFEQFVSNVETINSQLTRNVDYEVINVARKLEDNEFTYHSQLGYLSLQRQLQNDEMLAVSYEFSFNGQRYVVGELTETYGSRADDEVAILKLLRPTKINVDVPTWDLMMKNVYNLPGSQITEENFELRIIYRDDRTGQDNPSLHESSLKDIPLLQLFNLDNLNQNGDPQPDGNFDYIPNVTIDERNGKIIFPVLEPFGRDLNQRFLDEEQTFKGKYVFNTLYESTKNDAQQLTSKDKFFIKGNYANGSSTEIALPGINISPESVVVSAGGTQLQPNIDYRVDPNLGRVTILNQGVLNSGRDIVISFEREDLFNFQSKSLIGTRFDYVVSEKINFGATVLRHTQRPLGVSRYAIGSEPTNNTKWGIDINYSDEVPFLTRAVDKIPFIDTKAPSTVTFRGEFAQMIPGTSNKVNGEGASYIDDFEQSVTLNNLGSDISSWNIAATPETTDKRFYGLGEYAVNNRRAKLAWYQIEQSFYNPNGPNAPNIPQSSLENHYSRLVPIQEIYKNRDRNVITRMNTFDLAYYPSERGMYNFSTELDSEGRLLNPEQNWGGITRAITSEVDFDKSNIEYIEFWLLDPFIETARGVVDPNNPDAATNNPGKLMFNLGSVSEDILPDRLLAFENGLPEQYENSEQVSVSEFGRVPTEAPINEAFSNQAGARQNQDVGLDGVRNDQEAAFYEDYITAINGNNVLSAEAKSRILADPSADNFRYFYGDEYDNQQASILERYKSFNNYEGNTPLATGGQDFNPSGSRTPDSEDLNDDRTVATLEEYYEYELNLSKADLNVENNPYIVDEAVSNEEGVKWYLFRVPIREYTGSYGGITGFKSIRYIRTLLTGFEKPVVLRMVDFRLVGSQWREYSGDLSKSAVTETPETKDNNLTVSVVSIEANSESAPGKVPYVLPPGIQRDQDVSSNNNQIRQNEQSLQLCVDEFEDGEAVAAFKNVNFDLVNYGRLKMFLHAQSPNVTDDEVYAFVRLGTDFEDNYYEIELPLKITPYQTIDPNEIWPSENEIDLAFDELYRIKSIRNRLLSNVTLPYSEEFGKYTLTVRGRPDMSSLQTIMIGLRNPRGDGSGPKDICIWANEMRVTDFDQTSGWAANATLNTQLADFANITTSTRYTSVGFGGIEQNISQRTREASTGFDISANISLGKFFKEESGIKIPMYLAYQTFTAVPFYDPRDPDIPLSAALDGFDNAADREEYRNIVIEQERGRSINFTNVRKERTNTEKLPLPIAISNFDFTYAYSEFFRSNLQTAAYETKTYKGAIGYNYTFPNASIAPFESSEKLNSPYLKLVKDANFNPLPASFGFRGELDRSYVKTQLRNADLTTLGIEPQFQKSFTMTRSYNLNWNLTENINLNYTARARAVIDEAPGEVDSQNERDSIWTNLKNLGRMKNFDQSMIAGYSVPFNKLPLTDWVTADLRYKVDFAWTSGSLGQIEELGHNIQNSSEYGGTGRLDLNKLYNKVSVLNTINNPPRLRAGQKDTTFQQPGGQLTKGFLKLLMSVKNVTGSYSMKGGTVLPGYVFRPFLFGLDSSFSAPGAAFIFGSQDPSIRTRAANNGWLTTSTEQNALFSQSTVETINVKALLEPARDLNIQLDFNKVVNNNYQENYRYVGDSINDFRSLAPSRGGNYMISYNMIRTSFMKSTVDDAPRFEKFRENRAAIKRRLDAANPADGQYNLNQQDVLIPAFLAAYTKQNPENVSLNPVPKIPLPNWRIDYKGLTNIKAIKDIFPSVTLSHAYVSSFSINSYKSNSLYTDNRREGEMPVDVTVKQSITEYPMPTIQTADGQGFVPVYNMETVLISEKFSPLIGVSIRTKGRLTAKAEYRKERNLSLSTSTAQLTDIKSNDFVLDVGFTDPSFKLPFKVKGRVVSLKNDLTMQLSVTVRNTETVQRSIDNGNSTIVDGNINFQLRPTMNYTINESLNLNIYYQRSFNEPKLTNSFPSTNTVFGVQVRFGLQ